MGSETPGMNTVWVSLGVICNGLILDLLLSNKAFIDRTAADALIDKTSFVTSSTLDKKHSDKQRS